MDGILLVNKPVGWTSFDVVNKIRSVICDSEYNVTGKKLFPVGHTGTLDPLASGLLVILIGSYTKKAQTLIKVDKEYELSACLGYISTTGDEEGEKQKISEIKPNDLDIKISIKKFIGKQMQTPPAYSAIKINGQRAYKLARMGESPELKPREITIYSTELIKYSYPNIDLKVKVSSGVYVRTLVEDIGKDLSTGAYLTSLNRLKVGNFELSQAISPKGISANDIFNNLLST